MRIHNRRYTDAQYDLPWIAISFVVLISFTLAFHEEIWAFMDWVMTVTENFHAS